MRNLNLALLLFVLIAIAANIGRADCPAQGPQNIAVIIGDYPGAPSSPPNVNYLRELFTGTSGTLGSPVSIADFLSLISGHRASLGTLQFLGPYKRNQPVTHDSQLGRHVQNTMDAWEAELLQLAAKDTDLSKVDRLVFFTAGPLDSRSGLEYALGGGTASNYCDMPFGTPVKKNFAHAWIHSQYLYQGINTYDISHTWSQLPPATQAKYLEARRLQDMEIIMHEIGHTFGLGHANRIPRPSQQALHKTYDEILPDTNVEIENLNYGDRFSFMGNSAMGWPSLPHRAQLQWLSPQNIQEVHSNGTFRIFPNSTTDDNLKGLKIARIKKKKDKTNAILWVEYRQLLGRYEQNSLLSQYDTQGPLVYYTNPDQPMAPEWNFPNQTLLLSFLGPGTLEPLFPTDFTLKGEWKDLHSLVDLNVLSVTKDYLDIKMSFAK